MAFHFDPPLVRTTREITIRTTGEVIPVGLEGRCYGYVVDDPLMFVYTSHVWVRFPEFGLVKLNPRWLEEVNGS